MGLELYDTNDWTDILGIVGHSLGARIHFHFWFPCEDSFWKAP